MKALYKYPQSKFPYEELVKENGKRSRTDPEYELLDTGINNLFLFLSFVMLLTNIRPVLCFVCFWFGVRYAHRDFRRRILGYCR